MNESWFSTNSMIPSMQANGRARPDLSADDINSLLKGRKFGNKQVSDDPFQQNNFKPIEQYDPAEMRELEEFCQKRGIVGVNFNGIRPSAVLRMLKAKTGDRSSINETKRGLLNG
jgi:hypothetical protein